MFEKNYWVVIFIALLFFVFGFSLSYYFVDLNSAQPLIQNNLNNENTTSTEEHEEEKERISEYLTGTVNQIKEEEGLIIMEADLNLKEIFRNPGQDKAVSNFYLKEGTTTVYKISESSNLDKSKGEKIEANSIEEGDKVAISCRFPIPDTETLLSYNNFTAKEVLVIKKTN